MRIRKLIVTGMGAVALSFVISNDVASAQFSKSYQFLEAVRERDGTKATEFLNEPGATLINTRDRTTGDTALHIATERRDTTWVKFLLQKGANPNIVNRDGLTPLMLATQLRFVDGAKAIIGEKADINATNRSGETALIRAVQMRDAEMVRLLLANGADPDQTDTIAGLSARDYAERDRRARGIVEEFERADENSGDGGEVRIFGPTG